MNEPLLFTSWALTPQVWSGTLGGQDQAWCGTGVPGGPQLAQPAVHRHAGQQQALPARPGAVAGWTEADRAEPAQEAQVSGQSGKRAGDHPQRWQDAGPPEQEKHTAHSSPAALPSMSPGQHWLKAQGGSGSRQ